MDFKLDSTGDIAIENGDFVFVNGLEAIAQNITMTLRTWLGESPYARDKGVPYLQALFQRGTTTQQAVQILRAIILDVEGVLDVLEIEAVRDSSTRVVTITGRVRASDGTAPFTLGVPAS